MERDFRSGDPLCVYEGVSNGQLFFRAVGRAVANRADRRFCRWCGKLTMANVRECQRCEEVIATCSSCSRRRVLVFERKSDRGVCYPCASLLHYDLTRLYGSPNSL